VVVAALLDPGWLVEIEADALLGGGPWAARAGTSRRWRSRRPAIGPGVRPWCSTAATCV